MKLGLVGVGIVGNAFYEGMKHAFDIIRYDRMRVDHSDVASVAEVVKSTDGPIFICVPTPMQPDGHASTKIVEDVLNEIIHATSTPRFVVIKSTVPPGTTERLSQISSLVSVGFNPEFLTEANPVEDFKQQDRIIIGGDTKTVQAIIEVYNKSYPKVAKIRCKATEAEMVKYIANCFLATKVSFANEIYQICNKLNVEYTNIINMAILDKRLGMSHWKVPGPMPASDGTGKLLCGFGGSCFVKDINALIHLAEDLGVDPKVMKGAWEKNLEVRPEKDWENLKGRAIL